MPRQRRYLLSAERRNSRPLFGNRRVFCRRCRSASAPLPPGLLPWRRFPRASRHLRRAGLDSDTDTRPHYRGIDPHPPPPRPGAGPAAAPPPRATGASLPLPQSLFPIPPVNFWATWHQALAVRENRAGGPWSGRGLGASRPTPAPLPRNPLPAEPAAPVRARVAVGPRRPHRFVAPVELSQSGLRRPGSAVTAAPSGPSRLAARRPPTCAGGLGGCGALLGSEGPEAGAGACHGGGEPAGRARSGDLQPRRPERVCVSVSVRVCKCAAAPGGGGRRGGSAPGTRGWERVPWAPPGRARRAARDGAGGSTGRGAR